jgi:hypothetical protein
MAFEDFLGRVAGSVVGAAIDEVTGNSFNGGYVYTPTNYRYYNRSNGSTAYSDYVNRQAALKRSLLPGYNERQYRNDTDIWRKHRHHDHDGNWRRHHHHANWRRRDEETYRLYDGNVNADGNPFSRTAGEVYSDVGTYNRVRYSDLHRQRPHHHHRYDDLDHRLAHVSRNQRRTERLLHRYADRIMDGSGSPLAKAGVAALATIVSQAANSRDLRSIAYQANRPYYDAAFQAANRANLARLMAFRHAALLRDV